MQMHCIGDTHFEEIVALVHDEQRTIYNKNTTGAEQRSRQEANNNSNGAIHRPNGRGDRIGDSDIWHRNYGQKVADSKTFY